MKSTKEITIYDIARALDISASTVSRGLNDNPLIKKETRNRIVKTARELGYQRNKFASNLREKRTKTLGCIVPRLDSYFQSTVIAGMEKITAMHGYDLIISQSQESYRKEISCVSTLFNSRVDGFLVSLAYDSKNTQHFNILFKKGIPVVFFDRVYDCQECTSIVIDNFAAGYEITSHLIGQGCRRIVHLGGNPMRNVYSDRFQGYKKALEENGIPYDKELVFISELNGQAGNKILPGLLAMKSLPDGLFAANDTSAVSLICALKQEGIRIPDDIAVAGFNNDPISSVIDPNLTTIDYPGSEMGEIAAGTLINQLNSRKSQGINTIVLKHSLVIRQSSQRSK